jgi:peptide/nickel transport system permease protein
MIGYICHRAVSLGLSLIVASLVIFALIEIIPGDPAAFMLGINATDDNLAALRADLGLQGGWAERYVAWAGGMLRGDFGISYTYRVPVADLILDRIWISLPLAVYALALSSLLAFPLGVIAARYHGRAPDYGIMGGAQIGIAIPNFWFGMLLVLVFSITLRWFSAGGFPGWAAPGQAIKALTLPAIALALPQAAILARVLRSALLDTLHQDYMRTARAKGLSRTAALLRHGLPNAILSALTILGLQFSFLLAGAIVIENVFFLPGLGRLIFQAITQRDLIVVEATVMILVFSVIIITFLVDIAYAIADPRLRA